MAVGVGRSRRYPGLEGLAPQTVPLYRRALELELVGHHALDLGCGAGEGLRLLGKSYRRTTGLDLDQKALAFARQLNQDARLIHADATASYRCDPCQVVFAVDVLGHLVNPEAALRMVLPRLERSGVLVVVEPECNLEQRLVSPARRASSPRMLSRLLVRSGFEPVSWLEPHLGFIGVVARPSLERGAEVLADAESDFARGDLARALERVCVVATAEQRGLRLEAQLMSARIHLELDCRDAATAALLEAQRLDRQDPRPLAGLSRLALLSHNPELAEELAREALVLEPTELAAWCALGAAELEMGRPSLESWQRALALAPDSELVVARLSTAAIALGQPTLAIDALSQLRSYPEQNTVENRVAMGWLLAQSGETLKAKIEARAAASEAPEDPRLQALLQFLGTLREERSASRAFRRVTP